MAAIALATLCWPSKRQDELQIAAAVMDRKSGALKSKILNLLYLE